MTRIISNVIKGTVGLVYSPKPVILDKENFLNELKRISEKCLEEKNESKLYNFRYNLIQKYIVSKRDEIIKWLGEVALNKEEKDTNYRCQAITCLDQFYHPERVEILINCLNDDNPSIRTTAISTIGKVCGRERERFIPLLVEPLKELDFQVSSEAITALKHLGGKEAYNALYELVKYDSNSHDELHFKRSALLAMEDILWKELLSTPAKN